MAVQIIMNLVFLTVMARIVSKSAFGVYALLNASIGIINIFAEFGFGAALIQRDKNNKYHISFTFYSTLSIAILIYLILLVFSHYIVLFYDSKFSVLTLQAIGMLVIIRALGVTSKSLLIRELKFKRLFYAQAVSYFIGNLVIGFLLAYADFEIWALVLSFLATNLLLSIFHFIYRPHSLQLSFRNKENKEVFKYGKNLTIARVFNQFALNYDKFLLAKFIPFETLGLYERSQRLVFLPKLYIGTALDRVLFSVMSKVKDNYDNSKKMYLRFLSICFILLLFAFMNIAFFSEEVILLFLGENWLGAGIILKILSILIITDLLSKFGNTVARSYDRLEESAKIKRNFAIAIIIGCSIGVFFGVVETTIGYVLASLFHNFLMLRLSLKVLKSNWKDFFEAIKPTLMIGSILLVKNTIIMLTLGQGISTMIVCLFGDLVILLIIYFFKPSIFGVQNINFLREIAETINHPLVTKLKPLLPVVKLKSEK